MSTQPDTTIPEHSVVRLKRSVGRMHAGDVGTVVHVYSTGAYEVEFPVTTSFIQTCAHDDVEQINE